CCCCLSFFFQAEDGIRDPLVTGVQTCALPIWLRRSSVTVRSGAAEVTAAGSAFPVRGKQTAVVAGGDSPRYDVQDAIRSDDFDEWCESRNRRSDDSRSTQYVSRGVIAYGDLADNGAWQG